MVFQNNILAGVGGQGGGFTVDESVRYNDDDSPRLYRTPSIAGNRMVGSLSLWYKRCNLGSIQQLFNAGSGDDITFNASDKLTFIDGSVSYITTQVFRDPSAWGHLLFAWDTTLATAGDRLRIYHNGVEITAFDTETNPALNDRFEISNTVRQTVGANESDTQEFDGYLSQVYLVDGTQLTPTSFGEFDDNNVWRPIEFAAASAGSALTESFQEALQDTSTATTYTFSSAALGTAAADRGIVVMVGMQGTGQTDVNTMTIGGVSAVLVANADANDVSYATTMWYAKSVPTGTTGDIVIAFSSSCAICMIGVTAIYGDNILYAWGTDETGYNTTATSVTISVPAGSVLVAGVKATHSGTTTWTGVTEDYDEIDSAGTNTLSGGSIVYATAQEVTIIATKSKINQAAQIVGVFAPVESYGTNGIFLDFADSADFGNDVSGNNNDYTSSGLAAADQMTDTPTTNFCTWNSVAPSSLMNGATYSNGNLEVSANGDGGVPANIGVSSGKWYWEFSPLADQYQLPGMVSNTVIDGGDMVDAGTAGGFDDYSAGPVYAYYGADGNKFDASSKTSYGDTFTSGDVIGVAFDADNGILWYAKNGTYQNSATIAEVEAGTTTNAAFSSIDTSLTWFPFFHNFNTTAAAANFGQQAFSETVPTGFKAINTANLPAPQRIGHVDSQFVGAYDTGANIVATLDAAKDGTWTNYINMYRQLTIGVGANWQFSDDASNQLTLPGPSPGAKSSFVNPSVTGSSNAWNGYSWQVGAEYGVYTAEISHTNGADTDQAHGLTSDSSRFMAHSKRSDAADEWWIVHPDLTSGYNINFYWAAETATEYVTVDGTNVTVKSTNATGTYRVIVWAEMSGWRKFGKFTGNGSTDGPFLWDGGTPKMHVGKRSTAGEDYNTNLRARDPNGNPMTYQVMIDWTSVEDSTMPIDGTAGGVKIRTTSSVANGAAMITWDECTPFGGDGVSPATAV